MYNGSTVATTLFVFDTWLLPEVMTHPSSPTNQSPDPVELLLTVGELFAASLFAVTHDT